MHRTTEIECRSATVLAHNVRRLMAASDLSYDALCAAAGVDSRTLRGVVSGGKRPRLATLRRLATGLGAPVSELFEPPAGLTAEAFDAATNPAIDGARRSHPELFSGWTADEFAELASRFGVGGALTPEGAVQAAQRMNAQREVLDKARVVLESVHGEVLADVIDALYRRVRLND